MSAASADARRRKSYHHGSLYAALVEASVSLAREGGPDRVILREAARVAGVSHSAAYRHFADRDALMAAVSRRARSELAAEMRRRVDMAATPGEALGAVGAAYIDFALTESGLFRAAFTSHPTTSGTGNGSSDTSSDISDGGEEPFDILAEVLDSAMAAGQLAPERRPGAEIAAWSAVHGLASLLLNGSFSVTPADIEFCSARVFELIGRGLLQLPESTE